MTSHEKAMRPEDITRLFVERSNAGDADGVAALYEEDAVMAYPPGSQTVGRAAIRDLWASCSSTGPTSSRKNPCQLSSAAISPSPPHRRRTEPAPARRSCVVNPTDRGSACSTTPSSSHLPTGPEPRGILSHRSDAVVDQVLIAQGCPDPLGQRLCPASDGIFDLLRRPQPDDHAGDGRVAGGEGRARRWAGRRRTDRRCRPARWRARREPSMRAGSRGWRPVGAGQEQGDRSRTRRR